MLLVLKYSFSNVTSFIYIMYTSPRMVHPLPAHCGDGSVVLLKSRQWAGDTSIFSVVTVVHCPGYMGAIVKRGLHAGALEIVQQDCSCAGPEESFPPSRRGFPASQLATHNLRVRDVPSVIAHCAPFGIWEHLHPTLTLVLAAHQSHRSYKNKEESRVSAGNRLILCWLRIHLTDLQKVALWWWVCLLLLWSHVRSHWGSEKLKKQRKAGWWSWVACILRKYRVTKAIVKLSDNDPADQYRKSLAWLLPGQNTETQFKDTFQQLSA